MDLRVKIFSNLVFSWGKDHRGQILYLLRYWNLNMFASGSHRRPRRACKEVQSALIDLHILYILSEKFTWRHVLIKVTLQIYYFTAEISFYQLAIFILIFYIYFKFYPKSPRIYWSPLVLLKMLEINIFSPHHFISTAGLKVFKQCFNNTTCITKTWYFSLSTYKGFITSSFWHLILPRRQSEQIHKIARFYSICTMEDWYFKKYMLLFIT